MIFVKKNSIKNGYNNNEFETYLNNMSDTTYNSLSNQVFIEEESPSSSLPLDFKENQGSGSEDEELETYATGEKLNGQKKSRTNIFRYIHETPFFDVHKMVYIYIMTILVAVIVACYVLLIVETVMLENMDVERVTEHMDDPETFEMWLNEANLVRSNISMYNTEEDGKEVKFNIAQQAFLREIINIALQYEYVPKEMQLSWKDLIYTINAATLRSYSLESRTAKDWRDFRDAEITNTRVKYSGAFVMSILWPFVVAYGAIFLAVIFTGAYRMVRKNL